MDRVERKGRVGVAVSIKKWQRQVSVGDRAKGPLFERPEKIVRGVVLEANNRFVFIRREDTGDRATIRREDLQRPV